MNRWAFPETAPPVALAGLLRTSVQVAWKPWPSPPLTSPKAAFGHLVWKPAWVTVKDTHISVGRSGKNEEFCLNSMKLSFKLFCRKLFKLRDANMSSVQWDRFYKCTRHRRSEPFSLRVSYSRWKRALRKDSLSWEHAIYNFRLKYSSARGTHVPQAEGPAARKALVPFSSARYRDLVFVLSTFLQIVHLFNHIRASLGISIF